jgi:hypothetical protein
MVFFFQKIYILKICCKVTYKKLNIIVIGSNIYGRFFEDVSFF